MQKSVLLFDKHDAPIQLGKKLGTGGEGDVFELNDNLVVKVYHQPLSTIKQNKLMAMSSAHTPPLLEISTWPVGTVHLGKQGPVGGLVMPKLVGYKEIHKLYGPAHRKSEFPSADWSFLVQAARNTAAAIATLHQSGYVVGDINPGNLAVSTSALTKLIDCDSFQVKFNGQHYACEVGVAHFTPPELQGKSFSNEIRTPNHDNFGLALLCFHLLFMGRHPFAGKYKDGKEDMPIERAIREFRFAYGVKAASKGMAAPPNTLSLTIVGTELIQMFEAAFDQGGVFNGRPTASQWVKALDDLKTNLVVCTKHPSHKFYRMLSTCPWCALEKQSGTVFFLLTSPGRIRLSIDLGKVWQEILAITPPGPFYLPNFSFNPSPQPLPTPLLLFTVHSKDFVQEAEKRRAAVVASETAWNDIQRRWSQEVSGTEFSTKLAELKKVYGQLNTLAAKQKNDKFQLEAKAKELQLRHYLEQQHIDSAKINGIGTTRKVILASYGIETAADVDQAQIMTIPGFGSSLTLSLVQWRKSLESKFIFNSQNTTVSVEMAKLQYQHEAEYTPLESALLAGVEELKRIKEKIALKHKDLAEEAGKRASAYAQTQADWSLLKYHLEQVQRREAAKLTEASSAKSSTTVAVTQAATPASLSHSPNNASANQTLASKPASSSTVTQSSQQSSPSQIPVIASTPLLVPTVTTQTINTVAEPQLIKSASTSPISNNNSTSVDVTIPPLNTNKQPAKTKKRFTAVDVIVLILIIMLLFFSVLLLYHAYGT